jgi:hypothetical protein
VPKSGKTRARARFTNLERSRKKRARERLFARANVLQARKKKFFSFVFFAVARHLETDATMKATINGM